MMASVYQIGIMREKATAQLVEASNAIARQLGMEHFDMPQGTLGGTEYNYAVQVQAIADFMQRIADELGGTSIGDVIDYDSMTVAELKAQADVLEIDIPTGYSKPKIIALLRGEGQE